MNPKPGIKTTEFWLTVIVTLVGLAQALGFITPEEQNQIVEAVRQIVGGAVSLVAVGTYIYSRAKVKSASEDKSK